MNLRRLFLSFLLPLLLCSASALAQRTVSGTVTDSASKQGLPAVSVLVKGTGTGTQTSNDGRFTITVPANASTLVISSVGYATKEVSIGSGSLNISLGQANSSLTDVVVIGYGTARKRDLTGSIATVGEKDFQRGTITTPEQLISGKIPGVQITSNGGQPGSGSIIRIRGQSSLSSSQDPLIVIDGVPLENATISGSANALSLINPNDIESFTVLKDASAAAIYGSRASGGVILITTKKGKGGGKLNVGFSTVNSESIKSNTVDVLSPAQFTDLVNQMGTTDQKALLGSSNTNWQNEIYHPAFSTDNNISLSGGIKKLPYRLSFGYLDQDGILKTDNLKRTSGALSLTPSLFDNHLKISINVKGTIEKFFFANQGAIGSAVFFDPTQPIYDADSKYGGYFEWLDGNGNPNSLAPKNPVGIVTQNNNTSNVKRSIGNIVLDYKFHFLPDLHANLNLGYDVSHGQGGQVIPEIAGSVAVQGGYLNHYDQKRRSKTLEFYLNYVKEFASIKSRIDATAGYGYYDFWHAAPAIYNRNLKGDTLNTSRSDSSQNTLISYYGRINYSYNDIILLTATVRRDGSSRFAPDTRWGTFPSAALGINIIKNGNSPLNTLKLRLGYGETGQRDIRDQNGNPIDYPYIARYTLSNPQAQYQLGDQFYYTYRPEAFNQGLKWETTTTYNGGLDFGFFKGRLTASVDVYKKKTKDLLLFSPLAAGSNLSNQFFLNVGNMENKGVEVTISGTPVKTDDFNWNASVNFTYNENEITNLTQAPDPNNKGINVGGIAGGVGNYIQKYAVGYTANSFYVYKQVYDSLGNLIEGLYADLNRDGQINNDDKYLYKSPYPKFFFGFTSELDYKEFSLSFVLRANLGNYMYNNVASNSGYYTNIFSSNPFLNNASTDVLTTNFQRPQYWSDYYIQNASFLRMDNLNIGYNFGKVINKTANLRAGFIIQNVFVITKYKGLDPEIFSGIDNNFYPRSRIYSLGLNLDF